MKLSTTLSALTLFAASATASNLFQQLASSTFDIKLGGGAKVPGESPLMHCGETLHDILTVHEINLFPNPPIPGKTLTIKASGTLSKTVKAGAKVEVTVKYGFITLLKEELDLCEHVSEIDLKCPINPDKFELTKAVEIPAQVPPGKYTVTANAYLEPETSTAHPTPIVCLIGIVVMK